MKKTTLSYLCFALGVSLSVPSTHAAVVTASLAYANDNAITDNAGNAIAQGSSLILFGSFDINNLQIASIASTPGNPGEVVANLQSHFTTYHTSYIGDGMEGPDADYYFGGQSPGISTNGLAINGLPIYVWIVNSATLSSATQQIIYTGAGWVFPADADVPNVGVVGGATDSNFVVGGFGVGFGLYDDVALNMAIIPVPEPSTWASLAGGLALVGAFWARRRKTLA